MDFSRPYRAAIPGTEGDVLRVLAGSARPFTGREIARLAESTHTTVQRSLDRLVDHGLVNRAPAGRAALYTLNRDHLAATPVEALVTMRATLLERLGGALSRWEPQPIHASVFGSAARSDGDTASDIDLVVVRPDSVTSDDPTWREQVDDLAFQVNRWTGNHLATLELTQSDLESMQRNRPAIVDELRSDAITLIGPDVRTLLPAR
jgi:DNA-binding transcriptional ArsR family regulator